MRMPSQAALAGLLTPLVLLAGCAPSASTLLTLPDDSLARRQLQSRQFDTGDEPRILDACTMVLQDLGFQIDEASPRLGVLLATKTRDLNLLRPEARLAAVVLSLGMFAALAEQQPAKIEAGIVTRRLGAEGGRIGVRAIFRTTVFPRNGGQGLTRTITEPEIYTRFFDSLATALALEARKS